MTPRLMKRTKRRPRPLARIFRLRDAVPVAALVLVPWGGAPLAAQEEAVVVYVVRHAERADDEGPVDRSVASDPPLSPAGEVRARELAGLLDDVGLTHVHSTDYERTRATARPVAEVAGLPITLYDPNDLEALAAGIAATPGVHLVVGHSNTTPALVEALGADPGQPIAELEYDRIYVVYVLPGGATGSAVFRFGAPFAGHP